MVQVFPFYGDIDEFGRFVVEVPLMNTTEIYMDWGRSMLVDVLEPGEEYFVFHDLQTKGTLFSGKHSRFHNELARYNAVTFDQQLRPRTRAEGMVRHNYEQSLSIDDFLRYKQSQLGTLRIVADSYKEEYSNF